MSVFTLEIVVQNLEAAWRKGHGSSGSTWVHTLAVLSHEIMFMLDTWKLHLQFWNVYTTHYHVFFAEIGDIFIATKSYPVWHILYMNTRRVTRKKGSKFLVHSFDLGTQNLQPWVRHMQLCHAFQGWNHTQKINVDLWCLSVSSFWTVLQFCTIEHWANDFFLNIGTKTNNPTARTARLMRMI